MSLPASLTHAISLLDAGFCLSGIRSFRGMEGSGFNAYLLHKGQKVAFVIDDGNGGEIRIEWLGLTWDGKPSSGWSGESAKDAHKRAKQTPISQEAFVAFQAVVAATPGDTTFSGPPLKVNAGWLVSDLVSFYDLAKKCRTKSLFVMPGAVDNGSYEGYKGALDAGIKAHIEKTHPGAIILNEIVARYIA